MSAHQCRYCHRPITEYAPSTRIDAPVARPSRPSVRFTPFDIDMITNTKISTEPTLPTSRKLMSRMNEMCSLATVCPLVLGTYSAATPSEPPTISWPSSLPLADRPLELLLRTFRKSSRNPTAPQNTNRPSSTSAVIVGPTWKICSAGSVVSATCPATYASTVATTNATPPIVGVPFLPWWLAGPRVRIGCPALSAVNTRIATGVPNSETMKPIAHATMTALTGGP